jgi:bifunctional DNase/RNase
MSNLEFAPGERVSYEGQETEVVGIHDAKDDNFSSWTKKTNQGMFPVYIHKAAGVYIWVYSDQLSKIQKVA